MRQAQQLAAAGLLQPQVPSGDGAGTQQEAATAAGTLQQELAWSSRLSYARRVLQTPVSGRSSCTSSAAAMSPTRAAMIERTCS